MTWQAPYFDPATVPRSSSGGGGGGGTSTSYNETTVPDWVAAQVQQNLATANQLAAQPYQAYSGPTTAGFTADQLAAFQGVRDNLGSTQPAFADALSQVQNLPATTQSLPGPNPFQNQNPWNAQNPRSPDWERR